MFAHRVNFEYMLKLKNIFAVLSLFFTTAVFAQGQSHKVVVDKIIGVVGDRIILKSDVENAISDATRQGEHLPPNAACIIMEQAMLHKILAMQAEKDSLPVSDEEVEARLDMNARSMIQYYGSVQAVEEFAGKTIYQLKDDSRQQVKEQMLAEAMKRKIVENVTVTPSEVKAFFDKIPADSLPFLESELEIGQIVLLPKAAPEVEEYIYNEMLGYKQQIESGRTTFDALAKRVSEDPGSRERGGSYELNRSDKATWDPVFLQTAFRLKAGEISTPVKSNKFGYFLILQEDRRGDNAKVRMILRIPPVTETEIQTAKSKLDSVRKDIMANKINFKDAAYKYSDDEMVKNYGPYIMNNDGSTHIFIDRLDKDMVSTLKNLNVGDISEPVAFTNEQGKKGVRLVYLKSRTEPHRMNLGDDYSKIAERALEEKRNRQLDSWLTKKVPTYYVLIDKDAAEQCPSLQRYQTTQATGF